MNTRVLYAPGLLPERLLEGVARVRTSSLPAEHRQQPQQPENDSTHDAAVDNSVCSANPTAMTIGVRGGLSRLQLRRFNAIFEWLHKTRVDHFPARFGGEQAERIDLVERNTGVKSAIAEVR
jgi:hypothetical protein